MKQYINSDEYTVVYDNNSEIQQKVFDKVIEYFKKHQAYHGEVIMQCDNPIIDAPSVMAEIADDIIKFKVEYK